MNNRKENWSKLLDLCFRNMLLLILIVYLSQISYLLRGDGDYASALRYVSPFAFWPFVISLFYQGHCYRQMIREERSDAEQKQMEQRERTED